MQTKIEKPKHKHNKKRNTAFLFETLVKELTKAVVKGDKPRQTVISGLLKEHFKKNSILDKELLLYKQFYETRKFPKEHAEKLVDHVKEKLIPAWPRTHLSSYSHSMCKKHRIQKE